MKSIKKLFIFIFTVVVAFTSILKASAVDNTIKFVSSRQMDNTKYGTKENKALKIYGAETTVKTANVGGKIIFAYCFNHAKEAPNVGTTLTLNESMTKQAKAYEAAYTYVLFNGLSGTSAESWNNKYGVGLTNNDDKYYVTQLAIWGILHEYDSNNGVDLNKLSKDDNGNKLSARMQSILDNAKKLKADAMNNKYVEPKITISDSSNGSMTEAGNYYRTGTLKVGGFGYTKFNVSVSGTDKLEIIDSNGKSFGTSASFGAGQDFYVRMPASNVSTKDTTIEVKVSATGSKDNLVIYASDSKHQNIGVAYKTPVPVAASIKATAARKTGDLVISKIDTKGNYLAGATLVLSDAKGNKIDEWTTGKTKETNEKTFKNLAIGSKYVISEKTAPKGYKKIADATITKDTSKVQYVKVTNVEINKVKISKQDATTGTELPGAHLVLKDEKGNVVTEWTSGNEPHYVEDLKPGKYVLTETIAPEGYQLSSETVEFTVKADGTVDGDVVMLNTPKKGVTISKQDATTGSELPGAHLVVKDEKGNVVDEWDSTDKPHYIKDLADGTYTLTETIAPEGYVLSSETIKFTINHDGKVAEKVVMKNYPAKGVYISKQDVATAKELPGATLIVKDSDGNIIDEWVSTDKPHFIPNLKEGTYTLIEKKAPKGYGLSDEVIQFTIKNDGKAAEKIVMYNSIIPETGDVNFALVAFGLIASVAAGIFGFKKLNKQA